MIKENNFINTIYPITATAQIRGSQFAPDLRGYVFFKNVPGGTQVIVNIDGLPEYRPAKEGTQPIGPYGFHIHEKGICEIENPDEPYTTAGGHWNPTNQPHGNHAGDFPVLFSNDGIAKMTFFTDKFKVKDIINKSVIIHQNPDDYRSQPSGNAGKRIGCGIIKGHYF